MNRRKSQNRIQLCTTNDLAQQSATNQPPRNGGVWIQKSGASDERNQTNTVSRASSTPVDNNTTTSHSAPTHASQSSERPIADRDAFIDDGSQQQWQTEMSPAERARELTSEMDRRGRSSTTGSIGEKILKIGGKKEYKLH